MGTLYQYDVGVRKLHGRFSRIVMATWILAGFLGVVSWVQFDRATRPNNDSSALAASVDQVEAGAVIEPELAPPTSVVQTTSSKLKKLLNEFALAHPDAKLGISITSERADFSASLNPNQVFKSASLYKTVAAYRVLQMIQNGLYSLEDTATGRFSIADCIELAITVSDNTCGVALQSLSSPTLADTAIKGWGYKNTTLSGYYPETSAKDQNLLFSDIYSGDRLDPQMQDFLLLQLKNQRIVNRMPTLKNATIYHKTGDIASVVNSSALIRTKKGTAYTVSILSDEWNENLTTKYSDIATLHKSIHALVLEHEANL